MCGIVGIWNPSQKINKEVLLKMRDRIKHRGPDDAGIFVDEKSNLGLAQRRLSIIDLSEKGHQPMGSEDGSLWLTYNGEVYNFKEIKKELEKKGYRFRGNSDTEVVLKSFQEWGINCVDKFRGMFSFAVWDQKKEKLYLFRDRFGVKPLFYYFDKNKFLFASELKAICSWHRFKKEIDFNALSFYLQLGYIPAPYTIFKNTYKLEKGTILEVDSNFNLKKIKYWYPEKYFLKTQIDADIKRGTTRTETNEKQILDELEQLLKESFQYRMIADVEVGVFLSGGTDSSLVAAILQKNSSKKLKTFTIGFPEPSYDEAPTAKKVAEILGTEHYEYYLKPQDLENIFQKYVEIFDEPFGDSSGLSTYLLAKFTREKVKVVLSGDGGDELFFGYDKYKAVEKIKNIPNLARFGSRKFFEKLGPVKTEKLYSLISKILPVPQYSNLREKISKLTNLLKGKNPSEFFQLAGSYFLKEELKNLFKEKNFNSDLNQFYQNNNIDFREQMQLWDIENYLVDDILVKTDRTTMAVGLEAREPYLDQTILEYIAQVPPDLKFKKSKYLLKQILYRYLPEKLFQRPKTGFRLPMYEWLKKDWHNYLREYLDSSKIERQGIFNPEFIREMVGKYQKGKYINPDKLWLLLNFQLWYQNWLKKF